MHDAANRPAVLALVGPTASGKTGCALALARHLAPRVPVEIVSVDSALVYRGMDIGTAKPGAAERAAVPHHLIDIRDPLEPYSAAEFAADARRCIRDIQARGALPLLVGGTMLYLRALLHGIATMPAADPALRAAIDAEAAAAGWPALHAQLAAVDPATAARLAPHDGQRIQRALEVWRSTGRTLSAFHADAPDSIAEGQDLALATAVFSLEPTDRAWLHTRIEQRFADMLRAGFVDEVRALRARGDLHAALPAMRCVGYRQAWEWLDGLGGADGQALFVERGIAATRQLAKRQITWLRAMPTRTVVAADAPDAPAQLLAAVDARLGGGA